MHTRINEETIKTTDH